MRGSKARVAIKEALSAVCGSSVQYERQQSSGTRHSVRKVPVHAITAARTVSAPQPPAQRRVWPWQSCWWCSRLCERPAHGRRPLGRRPSNSVPLRAETDCVSWRSFAEFIWIVWHSVGASARFVGDARQRTLSVSRWGAISVGLDHYIGKPFLNSRHSVGSDRVGLVGNRSIVPTRSSCQAAHTQSWNSNHHSSMCNTHLYRSFDLPKRSSTVGSATS